VTASAPGKDTSYNGWSLEWIDFDEEVDQIINHSSTINLVEVSLSSGEGRVDLSLAVQEKQAEVSLSNYLKILQ